MGRDLSATICYRITVEFDTEYPKRDDSLTVDSELLAEPTVREWLEYRVKQVRGIEVPETPNYPDSAEHGGSYTDSYQAALEAYRETDEYRAYREARDAVRSAVKELPLEHCMAGNGADHVDVLYARGSAQMAHWHAESIDGTEFTMANAADYDQMFHRSMVDGLGIDEHPVPEWLLCPKWF